MIGRTKLGNERTPAGEIAIPDGDQHVAIDGRSDRHERQMNGKAITWSDPVREFAQALLRTVSPADVAAAVFSYGPAAVGARCAYITLLDRSGSAIVSGLGGHGVPFGRCLKIGTDGTVPWTEVLQTHSPVMFPSREALYRKFPRLASLCALPSECAVMTVPLLSAGASGGVIIFGFETSGPGPLSGATQTAVHQVALLAAQAARRAVLYDAERHAAEVLQRACLPAPLPEIAGLSVASRFFPAGDTVSVGGDWYDVFAAAEPRVVFAVGDVSGHGLEAAPAMAALRSVVRALAMYETSPGEILTRLNTYVCAFNPDIFATVLVAIFDRADEKIRFARAGHPPMVCASADGAAELLTDPVGPPLGIPATRYVDGERPLTVGNALVLYTDGVVERRDRSIDLTLAELIKAAAGGFRSPEDLCNRLTMALLAGIDLFDDAALLVATPARGEFS